MARHDTRLEWYTNRWTDANNWIWWDDHSLTFLRWFAFAFAGCLGGSALLKLLWDFVRCRDLKETLYIFYQAPESARTMKWCHGSARAMPGIATPCLGSSLGKYPIYLNMYILISKKHLDTYIYIYILHLHLHIHIHIQIHIHIHIQTHQYIYIYIYIYMYIYIQTDR